MATPSIYRLPNPNNPNVQDIYDAATNKKIPDPVTLARDYKWATEVKAPISRDGAWFAIGAAPASTPNIPAPTSLDSWKNYQALKEAATKVLAMQTNNNQDLTDAAAYWNTKLKNGSAFGAPGSTWPMNDASLNQLSYADQASLRLSAEAAAQAHLQGINQERKSREDNVGTVLSNLKDIYDLQVKSAQDERSFNLDKWYKEQQVSSQQKQDAQTAIDSALKNGITPTDTQLAVVGINSIDGRVGGTMPWRANNEGNIKYGAFAKKYGATQGPAATDGGFFAVFPDQETGTKAKMDLLASSGYVNLTLDKAMKRWSNNGYGAEIAPNLKPYTIGEILRYPELTAQLSEAMKKAEGYKEGTMFNAVKKNNTLSDTQINSTAKQLNLKVEEIKAMTDDQINQAVTDQQNNVYYRLSNWTDGVKIQSAYGMSAAEIAMILQLLSQGQSDTAIQSILDSNGIKSGALDNIKNLNKITWSGGINTNPFATQ